ncbi:heterokaryon incompatibility protein-domain-containing protein [Hypoxylon crocopeplum]|nr:heterokaryon incompatibility protein-domain-containing protein [Hypoxylon crocopeplum]
MGQKHSKVKGSRLPVIQSTDTHGPYLCGVCRGIAGWYKDDLISGHFACEIDRRVLQKVDHVPTRDQCSLCGLISRLLEGDDDHDTREPGKYVLVPRSEVQLEGEESGEYAIWAVNILGRDERAQARNYPESDYCMGLTIHKPWNSRELKEARNMNIANHRWKQGLVLLAHTDKTGSSNRRYSGILLDREKVDFTVVRRWIDECLQHHPRCAANTSTARPLRLIDCGANKIVSTPRHVKYLALSYVWGPPNKGRLATKFSLQVAPRVVKDAMSVVRSLGFRYLWVDRYCINQDDPIEKKQQIGIMDQIYEHAMVTIIDAAGTDDRLGLTGAGTHPINPRAVQPSARIGDDTFIYSMRDAPFAVRESKWATRGWTYQETLLSTRCLIFSKSQVFLVCKTTSQCETIPQVPRLAEYDPKYQVTVFNLFDRKMREDRFGYEFPSDGPVPDLLSRINTYQTRELTHDSDALNAFQAVLSRLELRSYWGIPFLTGRGCEISENTEDLETFGTDVTAAFVRGLAWRPVTHQSENTRRRSVMPAWSWVSVQGVLVDFPQDPGQRKEISDWVLRTWDPVTKLSVVDSYKSEDKVTAITSVTSFAQLWRGNNGQVITSSSSFLKLEAMIAGVTEFEVHFDEEDWRTKQKARGFRITVTGNEDKTRSAQRDFAVDCVPELFEFLRLEVATANQPLKFANPGWIVARLNHKAFTLGSLSPDMLDDSGEPVTTPPLWWATQFYLVLRPSTQGVWHRIGCILDKKLDNPEPELEDMRLQTLILG